MSTERKRRGLFWWGLRLGLLAVVIAIGTIAWWHFRPAMGIERQIVGTWRMSYGSPDKQEFADVITLTPSRHRIAQGVVIGGKWYMQGNRIHFLDSWYDEAVQSLLGDNAGEALDLTFEDEDTILAHSLNNDITFRFERLPD